MKPKTMCIYAYTANGHLLLRYTNGTEFRHHLLETVPKECAKWSKHLQAWKISPAYANAALKLAIVYFGREACRRSTV
jgi:hypothetical protein